MKHISVLGSTGSIGTQTLEVVRRYPREFTVEALACGGNIDLLERQVRSLHPKLAAVWEEADAKTLRERLSDLEIAVISGMDGLIAAATVERADILVTAIVGMLGIRPTIAAIRAGKTIALANKETLVTAGHLIMPLAKEKNVQILPVDSEHSAIFQSLQGNGDNAIRRILLTASGGPFRGWKREDLTKVTVAQALAHPNWTMGRKITIDSATMVNKGLEVMEARWLFDVAPEQIEVLIHPQSILHSAVEYEDGAVIGQMGLPDMQLPIQYALLFPKRLPMKGEYLDLFSIGELTFERPDTETFYGLSLAREALRQGGNMPTVFNAANERAVALFLSGAIDFPSITRLIEAMMEQTAFMPSPSVEEILATETEVGRRISEMEAL